MKKERSLHTSEELDKLELDWWNRNAEIVSKAWEMHDDVSRTVRKVYLEKARKFFQSDKKKMTILELGCGSGWVGQFIANSNLHIIGTDFSENQIQLAIKNAKKKGLEEYCKYQLTDVFDCINKDSEFFQHIDGVMIHGFLHHLNGQEIETIFYNIKKYLKQGTRLWIYEPAFYLNPTKTAKVKLN